MLAQEYIPAIIGGIIVGFLARLYMLRVDYRQYPSYPHGYASHLAFGFIGAALGAVAIPALLSEDFVAVTFLALAAQHFREVRNIERESLKKAEETELIPRGAGYIEGIAILFEARNYLAIFTALISTGIFLAFGWFWALLAGGALALFLNRVMVGSRVENLAQIEEEEIIFEGPNLRVGKEIIMNVGEKEALEIWKKYGMAVALRPKNDNARVTLANKGQRQAILHDVVSQIGVRLDVGEQHFTPLFRLELGTGRVLLIIIPNEPDWEPLKEAIKKTPVLETALRKPLKSWAGSKAED